MKKIRSTARTKALEHFAGEHGWKWELSDAMGVSAYFRDMKLFRQGTSRHGRHMIERKTGMFEHSGVMDYHYTVSSGKSSYIYKQTVYFRVEQDLMLPAFHIFPERWYHRISKWFGMQDINFVNYPEFSEYYLLQGIQPDFIEKFFTEDRLIHHFTQYKGWSVEGIGKYFVMYHPNMLVPVKDLRGMIKIGDTLFSLLKNRNALLEKGLNDETWAEPLPPV